MAQRPLWHSDDDQSRRHPDDGDSDDEHLLTRKRLKIQGIMTACVDTSIQEELLEMYESEGSWGLTRGLPNSAPRRLTTTWLWRLNPVVEPEEYVDSVCLRLGCAAPVTL